MARPATAAVRLLTGEREPVRLATTANIVLYGLQAIDGVATDVGDRVLVKDQADASQNGIYTASEGQWFRAADARTARTMQKGTTVHVQDGTVSADFAYAFETLNPVIGDTAISIAFYQSDNQIGIINAAIAAGLASVGAAITSGLSSITSTVSAGVVSIAAAVSAAGFPTAGVANSFLQRNAGNTAYDAKTPVQVRNALAAAVYVLNRTAVKALDPTVEKAATTYGEGRGVNGTWLPFLTSALSADDVIAKALDTVDGVYMTSTANALYTWVRAADWRSQGASASWFGVDTASADNKAALQAAINVTASMGADLKQHAGLFKLGSMVTVPPSTRIVGPGQMAQWGDENVTARDAVYHINHTGIGFQSTSAQGQRSVRGVSTYRTQPAPGAGWAPTNHDFDWDWWGVYDVNMEDVCLVNATNGIRARGNDTAGLGGLGCGRINLKNVKGQPMQCGIELGNCYDVVWMDEVGFWPFWSNQTDVRAYQRASATSFRFYRVDGPQIGRIFSIGYHYTTQFNLGAAGVNYPGVLPGGSAWGFFGRIHGDSAACILKVEAGCTPRLAIDQLFGISNSTGWLSNYYFIRDQGTNTRLSIGHCEVGVNGQELIRLDGAGAIVTIDRGRFFAWDATAIGIPAFTVTTGNRLRIGPMDLDATASPLYDATSTGIVETEQWMPYASPTITALAGTITTVGATAMRYQRRGKTAKLSIDVTITTIGTGTTGLTISLPPNASPAASAAIGSWMNTATAASGVARVVAAATTVTIAPFPVANGQRFVGSIEYEVA